VVLYNQFPETKSASHPEYRCGDKKRGGGRKKTTRRGSSGRKINKRASGGSPNQTKDWVEERTVKKKRGEEKVQSPVPWGCFTIQKRGKKLPKKTYTSGKKKKLLLFTSDLGSWLGRRKFAKKTGERGRRGEKGAAEEFRSWGKCLRRRK